MEDLGGLRGLYYEGEYRPAKGRKANSIFGYQMYIPVGVDTAKPLALVFAFDGLNKPACRAMETLIADGAMPPAVYIGIRPAYWVYSVPIGWERHMRMDNFDIFDPVYPNLLVDEIIPLAAKNHGITITDDPDLRLAIGSSSGAIASWNMAWFRNDSFHRVYLSSPSFLSMGNGYEYPILMGKFETKPIRVYLEYSENEVIDYFGSLFAASVGCEHALKLAGYDPKVVYYPGEGHSAHFWDEKPMEAALRYLWENWETEPVTVKRNSDRFDRIFDAKCGWTKIEAMPDHNRNAIDSPQNGVTYSFEGNAVYFEKDGIRSLAGTFDREIAAINISCDHCRLYVIGKDYPCTYAVNIEPDGTLSGRYIHGAIHTYTDFQYSGGTDLVADGHDRLYVATECGIQCVRPMGLIDAIAPMPGNAIPTKLAIDERADGNFLVAATADAIYERRLSDAYGEYPKGHMIPNSYTD